jgi:SAM-dependent methyltransferase
MLALPVDELRNLIQKMGETRYGGNGWRNHNRLWTSIFHAGVDGKRVLDYGCGVGLEALALSRAGATVDVADIAPANLLLASRVLNECYRTNPGSIMYSIRQFQPFTDAKLSSYDIFYCNGVLHHIWYPRQVMHHAWELLKPGGEARLMLYSDRGWRRYIGTEPPVDTPKDPNFEQFVRTFDQVGTYADWYSADKIADWFGSMFYLVQFDYITDDQRYCAAILRKKEIIG